MTGTWTDDDPRWDDDAATVPFGVAAAAPPPPRPAASRRGWPPLAAGFLVAGVGLAVIAAPFFLPGTWREELCLPLPTTPGEVQVATLGDPACGAVTYDRTTAVLATDRGRYLVGDPGDWLLVGDWDCDGERAPALYRPASGDVLTFDSWAEGAPIESAPPEPSGVTAGWPLVRHRGDCDEVVVLPARPGRGGPTP
jgi:hypothetical protein